MLPLNPLADRAPTDSEDLRLVRLAKSGDERALEKLVLRHQRWIYNIALRMMFHPHDAEDVTQEILVQVITHLSTFGGKSAFRTWLYRLAINRLLNFKRPGERARQRTFEEYGHDLDNVPDADFPDQKSVPADVQLYVHEARIGCTSAMLLCLDDEQRLVYVLGAIFGVTDRVGAELLAVSRDGFRQRLARARRDLHSFMEARCGLVNASNPCRCAKKARGFLAAGYIDLRRPLFARARVLRVREVAEARAEKLEGVDADYAEIHRDHPFQDAPDFVGALRALIERTDFKGALRS